MFGNLFGFIQKGVARAVAGGIVEGTALGMSIVSGREITVSPAEQTALLEAPQEEPAKKTGRRS